MKSLPLIVSKREIEYYHMCAYYLYKGMSCNVSSNICECSEAGLVRVCQLKINYGYRPFEVI